MHTDILRHLRDAVSTKRPEIWRANRSFLLHDNAPSHCSVLVKDFLAKNNLTIMQHPLYSPNLAPADFLPLPSTEISTDGTVLCDATDIIKNATEELKMLSQIGFQECFQHLYSRWQKLIVAQGDYFEGNVA